MPRSRLVKRISSRGVCRLEALLDAALEQTFPASDPVSIATAWTGPKETIAEEDPR